MVHLLTFPSSASHWSSIPRRNSVSTPADRSELDEIKVETNRRESPNSGVIRRRGTRLVGQPGAHQTPMVGIGSPVGGMYEAIDSGQERKTGAGNVGRGGPSVFDQSMRSAQTGLVSGWVSHDKIEPIQTGRLPGSCRTLFGAV